MSGQAIFSNISSLICSGEGRKYRTVVKRFGAELKRQKIVPTVRAGDIKNFIESEIITEEKIKKMFQLSWELYSFEYAEITIFTWE